jgi:hypothetical protein
VLNPARRQVIAASGHNIPEFEGERVITEFGSMLQANSDSLTFAFPIPT